MLKAKDNKALPLKVEEPEALAPEPEVKPLAAPVVLKGSSKITRIDH
jgi:hypothetical protein